MADASSSRSKKTAPRAQDADAIPLDAHAAGAVSTRELEELRRLLLARERHELRKLRHDVQRLEAHKEGLRVDELSRMLPEAVARRSGQDDQLSKALTPTIEDTLKRSVQQNPKVLVDAIFPLIGPAIRKSVSEALSGMLEAVNKALEHSLSVESIRWRVEAARTGKPFAEIVLTHTLLYRVEQIYLIDTRTGLPLQQVVAESVEGKEGAVVAGMMTAIQDFVRDSFGGETEETLATLQVGELTVWIEQGPRCLAAAVIRGVPAPVLRSMLREVVEIIHLQFIHELDCFDGDSAPFERAIPVLEHGLQARYKERRKKVSPALLVLLSLGLVALGVWGFFQIRDHLRWQQYIALLDAEPGILVTGEGSERGKRVLWGLRDPLAADPESLLTLAALSPGDVEAFWEPHHTLAPPILVRRARQLLAAPASVTLRFAGGTLYAVGAAPHAWREQARQRALFVAGVTTFDDAALVDLEMAHLLGLADSLRQQTLFFRAGEGNLIPGQEAALEAQAALIQQIQAAAAAAGKDVRIHIAGHASSEGTEAENVAVSELRASRARLALVRRGVGAGLLEASGAGTQHLPYVERTEADRVKNRRISYRVRLVEAG